MVFQRRGETSVTLYRGRVNDLGMRKLLSHRIYQQSILQSRLPGQDRLILSGMIGTVEQGHLQSGGILFCKRGTVSPRALRGKVRLPLTDCLLSPNLLGCGSKSWKYAPTQPMMRLRAKILPEKGVGGSGWAAWLLGLVPQAS